MIKNPIYIKNMVCPRCITAVEESLKKLNIPFSEVKLGVVVINKKLSINENQKLNEILISKGLELINDKKDKIISQIKSEIITYIHHSPNIKENFSNFLSEKLGYEYSYLSKLFSSVEEQTIEKYFILQRIEKVKELLNYNELSLSEISYELDYSSVQHLSKQFKNITGLTPSQFKRLENKNRKSLDEI